MNPHKKSKNKILIIGIDGGTFDVISPMIKDGKLPHISSLINNGTSGRLISTIPPVTAPAWSSFITGTTPGNHGILYFFDRDINQYSIGEVKRLVNLRNIKGIPFWRILNSYGYKVGLINIPLTYPPDKVDGFMISGMVVPSGSTDYVYPPGLLSKLDDYSVDMDGLMIQNKWQGGGLIEKNRKKFIDDVFKLSMVRKDNALKLMKNEEWDLFMVVFTGSDRISHFFWEDTESGEAPSNIVKNYYSYLDDLIGQLINEAGRDTIKIIMSDHGFGRAPQKSINAFALMKQLGCTAFIPGARFSYLMRTLLGKNGVNRRIQQKNILDWKHSKIYAVPVYNNFVGICINTKIEKKWGIVSPGAEYESLRSEVIDKLTELVDHDTGERLVNKIYTRETIYKGIFKDRAPDIIVQFSYDYQLNSNPLKRALTEKKLATTIRTGDHRLEGMFIASGHNIESGHFNKNVFIHDVTPTILYMMDVPIPDTYEGMVIQELFSEKYYSQYPPKYEKMDGHYESIYCGDNELSQSEFELSKTFLKNLGYL